MEAALVAKIISGSLVLLVSLIVGLLPLILSRKYPLLSPKDPGFNKKSGRNKFFSFLLNFGGGVLFANCFCHWLPEVREGKGCVICKVFSCELTVSFSCGKSRH